MITIWVVVAETGSDALLELSLTDLQAQTESEKLNYVNQIFQRLIDRIDRLRGIVCSQLR